LHPKKAEDHPINYAVPDFGVDHDIRLTHEHMAEAEESRKLSFDPTHIPPEAYEDEFDLKPIWEKGPTGYQAGSAKAKGLDYWLGK